MSATKQLEARARIEPILDLALDEQAKVEHIDRPDIVRKALWDYLVKAGSPLVLAAVNGRKLEGR